MPFVVISTEYDEEENDRSDEYEDDDIGAESDHGGGFGEEYDDDDDYHSARRRRSADGGGGTPSRQDSEKLVFEITKGDTKDKAGVTQDEGTLGSFTNFVIKMELKATVS